MNGVHEKAYSEGKANIRDQYRKQVNLACNKGYYLEWMVALKKLYVPEDSPLGDTNQLDVPFPPSPTESEEEEEDEETDVGEAEEEAGTEVAAEAKSLTLNIKS